jgi:iron complex outermembrane receptor protein
MKKNRLALTLIATLAAGSAVAQTAPTPAPVDPHHKPHPGSGSVKTKDLDSVVVTAAGVLRDAATEVSRPVDVITSERLDESRAASLGETISGLTGVQSSNFGPGVGRPIVRGMDGPRVAVLSNGLSGQDASTVSQDHAPAIEPFLADQIEVLKGPSTLLYGSGAIGGVVNVVDGRIAETAVDGINGRVEARFDTGNKDGETSVFRIDGGNGSLSLHADGVYRNVKDYSTPEGKQANTFLDTKSGSLGASLAGDWGFAGVSVTRFDTQYGNPGEPGDIAAGERGVWLKMRQDEYDAKGGFNNPWGDGTSLRWSFGHTSYQHTEFEGDVPGTVFQRNANQGRLEAGFDRGGWKTAVGMQFANSTFAATGEEAFIPVTNNKSVGLFTVGKRTFGAFDTEIGARIDQVKYSTDTGLSANLNPFSVSASGLYRLNDAWRLTASVDHAERAPAEEELFADGPHIATLAYEKGDPNLGKEAANQIELGLQYRSDFVDAKVSAYYNRYADFIYLADTDDTWYFADSDEDLPVRQWSQANAVFHGFEGEATFHLADNETIGTWDLRVFGDTVRARLTNGENLPRIAPARLGTQLRWENKAWRASLETTRYMAQNNVAEGETPTAGYNMIDTHVVYHFDHGRTGWEIFLDGNNLGNVDARVHTSFLKDKVLLPGRNWSFGVRAFF